MTKLEEFKRSLNKLDKKEFPLSLIYEWVKTGKLSYTEFESYMFQVEHKWL